MLLFGMPSSTRDLVSQTCFAIATRHAAGEISAEVAVMEMLLATEDAALLERVLSSQELPVGQQEAAKLRSLVADNRKAVSQIAASLRVQPSHPQPSASESVALVETRQLFDQLVADSEEASVAMYSLGNASILEAATAEIIDVLTRAAMLTPSTRVLDLGCGIGRMEVALASQVASIDGIDLSPAMVAVARRRCAELHNVRITEASGRDLVQFTDRSIDLVVAIDCFPYVVGAGPALTTALFAEIARVLRGAGELFLCNFSYRDDLLRDRADVTALAALHGFRIHTLGEQPFRLWNGALFRLQRLAV
jgi:cyclopropane fatty-acyl-phospholipid synthase-like methyltransferase